MPRVLYLSVVVGLICAGAALRLNGMHLHDVLKPPERLMLVVAFLSLGALIGAIAVATGAIVQAIQQQKTSSERKRP